MSKEEYLKNRIKELKSNQIKISNPNKFNTLFEGEIKQIDGWDLIFQEIEGSLNSELPIRVKNWLRNKFHSPVKK